MKRAILPPPALRHRRRGMTLIEVVVAMGIFLAIATIAVWIVQETVRMWQSCERRRVLYERAGAVLDRLNGDLSMTSGRDIAGADVTRSYLLGGFDPATGCSWVRFTRTFEAGPERAQVLAAGDGRPTPLAQRPFDPDAPDPVAPPKNAPVDTDDYTGLKVGDFRALGGLAQVGFVVRNGTLYRTLHAPAPPAAMAAGQSFDQDLAAGGPNGPQPVLSEDVLYLTFEYWHQKTVNWDADPRPADKKSYGPELIWDSTRGITAGALKNFGFFRRADSVDDPSDDIFPRMIRVTAVIDSPYPRCQYTKLVEDLGDNYGMVFVESTAGFPDGGTSESFIYIEGEWIRYKEKLPDAFVVAERGARGTTKKEHLADAPVRIGRLFRRVVFLNNYREDFMSNDAWFKLKDSSKGRVGFEE